MACRVRRRAAAAVQPAFDACPVHAAAFIIASPPVPRSPAASSTAPWPSSLPRSSRRSSASPPDSHAPGSRGTWSVCRSPGSRSERARGAPEMELGRSHFVTQRPSDPGIQRPGDPVDPVTLFYNELQMSKKYSQAKEFLIIVGKKVKVYCMD